MKNGLEINKFGTKFYYNDDKYHREDGPAIEDIYGYKAWYINGKRHREDGPAVEFFNGDKRWFYHDEQINVYSNEEFFRMLKLKLFW